MKKDNDNIAKIKSLLKEAESRPLTKDEVQTIFDLTRKRIREIEQKAVNRLKNSKKAN
jgi:DNA-directed RNA polymerase sigma subunit (sigma70/sigma32)